MEKRSLYHQFCTHTTKASGGAGFIRAVKSPRGRVTDAFDFLLSITRRVAPLRESRLPNALLSGYDLDRISAASLFAHPSFTFLFRSLFAVFPLFFLPAGEEYYHSGGRKAWKSARNSLKAVVRAKRGTALRSNESMKNNTCPAPAAKIVNAARYIRRQTGCRGRRRAVPWSRNIPRHPAYVLHARRW